MRQRELINRQAAIDYIKSAIPEWSEDKEIAIDCLMNTPSAQPSDDYKRGWKDGQDALLEEIWENERERFD